MTSRRARAWLVVSLLVALLLLAASSTPRHVGDSGEYVAMSLNLARFELPSLTAADLAEARSRFPGDAGVRLTRPVLRSADGRQDLAHFWFYSLLAAPFVRAAMAFGADPLIGFTILNIAMLSGLVALLSTRLAPGAVVLLVASPILWWVDKAHTEVFTFSLICIALLLLRSAPWWSIAAFGAAATQNPPMSAAMVLVAMFAVYQQGWRDRRVWFGTMAGGMLAVLHPAYYYSRLGTWSGLADAIDRHWPSLREFVAVALDPNLGVFAYAPLLAVVMGLGIIGALRRPDRRTLDLAGVTMAIIAVLFLFSFTQTANLNSGGTPGPSRYGLWLVPFAVPLLGWVGASARWLGILGVASGLWCAWMFAPSLPERYLQPSALASFVWQRFPDVDNPLAEVFAERLAGHESAWPPVATPGCEKVLLSGDGSSAAWPVRCTATAAPDWCVAAGGVCYANQSEGGYDFVRAPATPAWRVGMARRIPPATDSVGGMLAVTQPVGRRVSVALWHDQGWSYPEQLTTPGPDDVFREWRWIDQRALVGVNADSPVTARFELVARAFNRPRRLRISVGGREVATHLVASTTSAYTTPEFTLPAGRTLLVFESLDGSDPPNTTDPRRLSIQLYRIELVVTR